MNIRGYEPVIGVEVHTQLATRTKLFCSCENNPRAEPNTTICEVCTGQPGALPVLNEKVVEYALLVAAALNCRINRVSEFSRKHYFYPDLPKNFQITQAEFPIAEAGSLSVRREDGTSFTVRIRRIHIEEDAGKSTHGLSAESSFVDLNRAGTPLLEIVSEPDIQGAQDVRSYLKELHSIVTMLGTCSGNMEEGAFRADTNISVRRVGSERLGTRCELKNINSFKFISDATSYEIERQIELLESGELILQETRLWDTRKRVTIPMRSKEEAADYRYMPEPDLPLLTIKEEQIEALQKLLPELPAARVERLMRLYGLTPYEATIIGYDTDLALYYEKAFAIAPGKQIVHWILRNLLGFIKESNGLIALYNTETHPLRPAQLGALVNLVESGAINGRIAQEVFIEMAQTGKSPALIVRERGLEQIGSDQALEEIIVELLQEEQEQVVAYRAGKTKLWGFFVGKVMEKTEGRAQPAKVAELLRKKLG